MKISDIKSNPKNPRKITDSKLNSLKKSLETFGDLGGIVFNVRSNQLVGGHQRVKTLSPDWKITKSPKKDKTGTVAVGSIETPWGNLSYREVDWDSEIESQANIAANKHGGEFDRILLSDAITSLGPELDNDLIGFSKCEISRIVGLPDEDVDVEKEVSKKADDIKVNLGDIFELGNHRLICGDGINSETFNRLLGGGGVDLLITDPPYGVSIGSKNKDISRFKKSGIKEDILNDNLDAASLRDILIQVFKNSHDKLNQGASFYVTAPQGGSLGLMMQTVMKDSGLPVNHVLIWVKNAATFSLGRLDYSYQHEPIFYGWKEGSHKFYGKNETSVWKIDKPVSSKLHPTMKPIELYARAMCNSSVEGDIILDPFGGSGTCIMAAESLNRKARVIELDPHYCSVIISRWELATGKKHKTLK